MYYNIAYKKQKYEKFRTRIWRYRTSPNIFVECTNGELFFLMSQLTLRFEHP